MWFFFPAKLALLATPTLRAKNLFAVIPRASAAILALDSRGRNAADGIVAATAVGVDASTGLAAEIAAVSAVPSEVRIAGGGGARRPAAPGAATASTTGL